jgi:hypothetical protein
MNKDKPNLRVITADNGYDEDTDEREYQEKLDAETDVHKLVQIAVDEKTKVYLEWRKKMMEEYPENIPDTSPKISVSFNSLWEIRTRIAAIYAILDVTLQTKSSPIIEEEWREEYRNCRKLVRAIELFIDSMEKGGIEEILKK